MAEKSAAALERKALKQMCAGAWGMGEAWQCEWHRCMHPTCAQAMPTSLCATGKARRSDRRLSRHSMPCSLPGQRPSSNPGRPMPSEVCC